MVEHEFVLIAVMYFVGQITDINKYLAKLPVTYTGAEVQKEKEYAELKK